MPHIRASVNPSPIDLVSMYVRVPSMCIENPRLYRHSVCILTTHLKIIYNYIPSLYNYLYLYSYIDAREILGIWELQGEKLPW